jgi:hypothetical protein
VVRRTSSAMTKAIQEIFVGILEDKRPDQMELADAGADSLR